MLTQDIKDIINGRIIMKDGRTVDQIYKGFMLYKSGKAPAEFTATKETTQYEGSLDDVKRQIDKYWEKKDAEVVLKRKNAGDKRPKHPRWRIKGDRHSVRDVSPGEKVKQYINSIHNPSKKKYAEEYFHYEQGRSQQPRRPSDLSAMGAQAVEMRIQQLLEGGALDQASISRPSAVRINAGGKKCSCGGRFVQSSVEELSGGRKKRTEKCDKCGRSQIVIDDKEGHPTVKDVDLDTKLKMSWDIGYSMKGMKKPEVISRLMNKYGVTQQEAEAVVAWYNFGVRANRQGEEVKDRTCDALDPNETHDIRDIEKETKANDYFRKVLFTAERMQLVVMCIKPGEDIGEEVHPTTDQFFRIEEGEGKAIVDGREINIKDGSSILIKSGRVHNIINDSNKPLKLYSLYSPPHHRDGLIQEKK